MKRARSDSKLGAYSAAVLALLLAGPLAAAPGGGKGGGGGGGGGGDGGGGIRYDMEVLPAFDGPACAITTPWSISEDRDWIGGSGHVPGGCSECPSGAVLWRRDASAGWLLFELPHLEGGNAGSGTNPAWAVLDGGIAVGRDAVFDESCTFLRGAPVIWEPVGPGLDVWVVTELPSVSGSGAAYGARDSSDLGLLVVGAVGGAGPDPGGAMLWRRVDGSWSATSLGSLGGESRAEDVNASGVVVGSSADTAGNWFSWVIQPLDTDGDGFSDTWYRDDSPADGVNDLMQQLSPTFTRRGAQAVNVHGEVVGDRAPGATHWAPDGEGGYSETLLPAGGFSTTRANDLNDHAQVVGQGDEPGKRGNVDQRGALWELEAGSWVLTVLDEVTEKGRSDDIDDAQSINGCGDIVGNGSTKDANNVALILTPRTSPCD